MSMIYCHKCGKLVNTNSVFCCRCGEKINEKAAEKRELVAENKKSKLSILLICISIICILILIDLCRY